MRLSSIIKKLPDTFSFSSQSRPYINHSVEMKGVFSAEERADALQKAGLNVFFFPAEMITGCDLLSDSGTTAMTNEQWAALHLGDEAYGSNRGYFLLMEQIRETFGDDFAIPENAKKPNSFIFHQGRSAEDALFSQFGKIGSDLIIPSNGHFDTTAANIEANNIQAANLFSPELRQENSASYFKGNMDLAALGKLLKARHKKIPAVFLTITNNTGGGQPVSMQNIKEVRALTDKFQIPLFFDACRFAENAWFIKNYEASFSKKSVKDIVKEMFSFADAFTISFKKDGLVNMGGGFFLKNNGLFMKKYPEVPDALMNHQITKEGHPTYGGMSGRDIMALVAGLKTVLKEEYLSYRVSQVREFGEEMARLGLPVLEPIGGHAVYLDMNKFFAGTKMKPENFGGISFTALLLAAYGHRACELGNFAFGKYNKKTKKEELPEVNFVRFAVPRLRYEKDDLKNAAEAAKALYDNRDMIPKIKVVYGRDLPLRHFKARFAFSEQ